MRPVHRITADGKDVTEVLAERLLSLRLVDEDGLDSDTLELRVDDRDGQIVLPRTSVELTVALGYDGKAQEMGLYVVDEVELSGPADTIRITGRAANFSNSQTLRGRRQSLREPRTRSWHELSFGELVEAVAAEHGFQARVGDPLAGAWLEHVDQLDESDLHLLARLARDRDGIAKPAGGRLIVVSRAEARTADGRQLEAVRLGPADLESWRVTLPQRSRYASVVAHYHDIEQGEVNEVTAGSGEPVYRLRREYPDAETASWAANARLRRFNRGTSEINLELAGDPRLAAGTPLELAGFREGVNGSYRAERVEHVVDDRGYRTLVRAEGE